MQAMFSEWECPSPVFSCFMLTEVRDGGIRRRKEKGDKRRERREEVK